MTDQQNIFDEKLIDIRKKRVKNNFSTFIDIGGADGFFVASLQRVY